MLGSNGEEELAKELLAKNVKELKEETAYFSEMARSKDRRFKRIGRDKLDQKKRDVQQSIGSSLRLQDTASASQLQMLQARFQ
jgi:AMMECR1 domain-containing protein